MVVLGVLLVVLVSRTNHRRLLMRPNSTGQRRLSRCASTHLSITDEDVARMPGNRIALRRSLQASARCSPYTPMSSRDTLEARSAPRSPWQSGKIYQYDNELVQAWPLPRRLQRSQVKPTVKLRSSPAHATKEKDQGSSEKPPVKRGKSRTVILPGQPEASSPMEISIKSASPTDSHLTPKPLFHGQQRSISHSVINDSIDRSKRTPVRNVGDSLTLTPRSLDTTALQRSTSMYHEPGPSPTQLLPPLPFQIEAKVVPKRVQSPTEFSTRRLSGGTYLSDNTSILDGDETPKAHSRAETELSSIDMMSPRTIDSTAMSIAHKEADQEFTDSPGRLGGLTPSKKLTFRPPLDDQTSFRASVHESSSESKRDGLSVDVSLHCSSNAASIAKLIRGMNFDTAKLESSRQRRLADETARQEISRRGRSNTTFHVRKDTKSHSSPPPVPGIVSGNEGWINSNRSVPGLTVVATETVQNRETVASRPRKTSSSPDVTSSLHKRKHSPSVTEIPLVAPIPPQNIIEERTVEDLQDCPSPKTVVNLNLEQDPKFRPPSLQTFDPQLPTEARKYNPLRHSRPVSQHLSLDGSQDEDDSPDTEIYTPTRKPSSRRHHLNRLKSIFSTTSDRDSWPLTNDLEPIQDTLIHNHHSESSRQSEEQGTSHAPPTFSINLPHFPSPPRTLPRRHNYPTWRGPRILIHGPRAAPWSSHNISTARFPARTSPHRGVTKARGSSPGKANTSSSRSPRRNVLALENAMTLRRMNSEAQSEAKAARGSPEHKRYLSIGSWESAIFEDEGDDEGYENVHDDDDGCGDHDDDDVVEGLRKGVRVVSFLSTIPTTPQSSSREADLADWEGGLYDADGFLKEA